MFYIRLLLIFSVVFLTTQCTGNESYNFLHFVGGIGQKITNHFDNDLYKNNFSDSLRVIKRTPHKTIDKVIPINDSFVVRGIYEQHSTLSDKVEIRFFSPERCLLFEGIIEDSLLDPRAIGLSTSDFTTDTTFEIYPISGRLDTIFIINRTFTYEINSVHSDRATSEACIE